MKKEGVGTIIALDETDGFFLGEGGPIHLDKHVQLLPQRRQWSRLEKPKRSKVPPGPCLENLLKASTKTEAGLLSCSVIALGWQLALIKLFGVLLNFFRFYFPFSKLTSWKRHK